MQKKVLGILIALVMVLSLLPAGALADAADQNQVVYEGGTVFYDAAGNPVTNATSLDHRDAVVEMSKTIEQYKDANGPVENEFVVTMNVRTRQNLLEISSDTPDAAVLLVMDVSNSMDDCVNCGNESGGIVHNGGWVNNACPDGSGNSYMDSWDQGQNCDYCGQSSNRHSRTYFQRACNSYQMRLTATQNAAKSFLESFANDTGAQDDDKRMVAIVSYGTNAYTRLNWVNVRTQRGMDAAQNAITNLNIANGEGTNGGGTSIEAGMALGRNLLKAASVKGGSLDGIDYLYTIMLTDGLPTYGGNSQQLSYSANRLESISGDTSTDGSTAQESDYNDVAGIANEIKAVSPLSKLYSICIGKIANGNSYTNVWDETLYGNVTVGDWLDTFSTDAFYGEEAETAQLFDSFNSVLAQIQLATKAWKVEDWMGRHMVYVEEVPVYAGRERIYNHVTTNLSASDYDGDAPEFLWDLLSSNYNPDISDFDEDEGKGILGYTYKYKVRLCNLDTAYDAGTEIPANELATLRYVVSDENGNYPSEYETGKFAVPTVEAYEADIEFEKVDGNGKPLPGWQFRVRLDTDKAHPGTEPHFIYKDSNISENDGKLTITGIPSGHDYTLLEAEKYVVEGSGIDPDHYIDAGDHPVTVSWGQVIIDDLEDADNDGLPEVVNEFTTEGLGAITLQKSFAEGSVKPYSIEFTIVGGGTTYNRSLYASDDQNNDGVWEWTLTGLRPGVDYTITEANAVDENGNHLRGDHNLSYTITSGTQSISKTFVEGDESTYPAITVEVGAGATVAVHFNNNITKKTGALTVEKAFEGVDANLVGNLTMTVTATPVEANGAAIEGAVPVTKTLVKGANGVYTAAFDALPIGYYKLEETIDTAVPGYTHEHYVFGQDGVELTNDIVYVDEENAVSPVQIVLTNHYTQDMGRIHVQKYIIAEDEEELAQVLAALADRTIQVDVTQNGKFFDSLYLSGDEWNATSILLPVGEYKLVENHANAHVGQFVHEVLWPNGDTVMVGDDTVATVQLVNDYYETDTTGQLTVSKYFDFEDDEDVALPDEMYISVFATMVDENGAEVTPNTTFEFQINPSSGDLSSTLTLPEGRYKLTEEVYYDIPNFIRVNETFEAADENTVVEDNIVTVVDDAAVAVDVTNIYEKLEGGLVITKAFYGDEVPDEAKANITFTITGPDAFEELEIKYSDFTRGYYVLRDLPVGDYTIVESNANVDGYIRTTTSTSSNALSQHTSDQIKVHVADGAFTRVDYTNSYNKQEAYLGLYKTFVGDTTGLTDAYKSDIVFTVTGPDNFEETVSYTDFVDGYFAFEGVALGEYTVVERNVQTEAVSEYNVTTTYKVNGAETNKVTLADGDEVTVEITNSYNKLEGGLVITKIFEGDELTEAQKEAITFTVTGPEGFEKAEIKYSDFTDGKYVFEIVPIGTYTIMETNADVPGYVRTTTTTSSSAPLQANAMLLQAPQDPSITVEVADAYGVAVTFTNSYNKQEAYLGLYKTFVGDTTGLTDTYKSDIVFTVTGPDNFEETVSYTEFENGYYAFEGVALGEYTVVERNVQTEAVSEYNVTTTYKVNGAETNKVTLADGDEVTVEITNSYNKLEGGLVITKIFDGDELTEAQKEAITFTVTGPEGFEKAEIKYSDFTDGKYVFEIVPIGTYTIVEINADVPGYVRTTTTTSSSAPLQANAMLLQAPQDPSITVEVADAYGVAVTFTNSYNKQEAYLSLYKTFVGDTTGLTDAYKSDIVFTVTGPDNFEETVSYTDFVDGYFAFEGVALGEYTVVERNVQTEAVSEYNVTTTYKVNGAETNKVTLADGDEVTVEITNSYNKLEGGLVITKIFDGDELTEAQKEAITFTVTGPEGFEKAEIKYSDFEDGRYVFEIVPIGTYTIVETNADVPGYVRTTTTTSSSAPLQANVMLLQAPQDPSITVEVADEYGVAVTFTNSYNKQEGDLVLYKTFAGEIENLTEYEIEGIKFTVTGTNFNQEVYYCDFVDGCYVFDGLEPGMYTVEETYPESAYNVTTTYKVNGVASTSNTVELKDGESLAFTIVNTYDAGEDIVIKIPFSKTVKQTGTADPGTNTFYIEYSASNALGEEVKLAVRNDPLNKYGRVDVVKDEGGFEVIAVTVNGANTVSGYFEVTGKAYEMPVYVYAREANGLNWELDEKTLKEAGWTYDVTAFPYKYEEVDGELWGWVHSWHAEAGVDQNGTEYTHIFCDNAEDSIKSEITFVNTYSADVPVVEPPKTGDDSNVALWLALMGASIAGVVLISKRRKTC